MIQSWAVKDNINSRYLTNNGFVSLANNWFVMYRTYTDAPEIQQLKNKPGKMIYLPNGDADSF